jgi:hypothetical protein
MNALGWPYGHRQLGRWGKINRGGAVRPFTTHGGQPALLRHYVFGKVKTRDISIATALAFARRTGSSGYYVLCSQNRSAGRLIFVSLSFFIGHLSNFLSLPLYLS